MKKILISLTVVAAMLMASVAFAGGVDGASLYKRCQGCHGADGAKLAMGVGAPIKGQSAEELLTKLKGYAEGTYGQSKKKLMTNIVKRLSDEQLKVLADFIAAM